MENKKRIILDFETRSAAELKKIGAFKYSRHPTTQPTCLAFKEKGKEKVYLLKLEQINRDWYELPESFRELWVSYIVQGFTFAAHNAFFEQCIYFNILVERLHWPAIHKSRWMCTAAKAAAHALPRSLEGVGEALRLHDQKDKAGYNAMMATCKPTKKWAAWARLQEQVKAGARISEAKKLKAKEPEPEKFLSPKAAPDVWNTLYRYCIMDVKAEEAVDDALPDLSPNEQKLWLLNQRLNWQGIRLDIPMVKRIVFIMEIESKKKLTELDSITMGLVTKPGARKSILEFLALEGIELPDIRKNTVENAIKNISMSDTMKRLLEIRRALSKTSTKKYQGMLDRAESDERVRDILLYHGASTGRDSGTGVQFHNLPRPLIKQDEIEEILKLLQEPQPPEDVVSWIECFYGDVGAVFSSLLRSMMIPREGKTLIVADFSKIEVAVLWWLADNYPGIQVLKAGKDVYKYQAAENTGKTYEEISDDGGERQLGKAQTLGCGFGMSWEKFQSTALELYGLKLSDEQAQEAVSNYRKANEAVPKLWATYERAAIEAIEKKKPVKAGKCVFYCSRRFLHIVLPSGRKLSYLNPRISWREREYTKFSICPETGETIKTREISKPKKTIEFYGLAKDKKKMQLERTWGGTLTENIVQSVARDLMMDAMLRVESEGYTPLLMVHDEGIGEIEKAKADLKAYIKLLCKMPMWGDDNLVIEAKGWTGLRYRK